MQYVSLSATVICSNSLIMHVGQGGGCWGNKYCYNCSLYNAFYNYVKDILRNYDLSLKLILLNVYFYFINLPQNICRLGSDEDWAVRIFLAPSLAECLQVFSSFCLTDCNFPTPSILYILPHSMSTIPASQLDFSGC